MYSARDQVVTCAFRRALGQNRGFDIDKSVLVKILAGNMRDPAAHDQILLHARASEVEITVFQS